MCDGVGGDLVGKRVYVGMVQSGIIFYHLLRLQAEIFKVAAGDVRLIAQEKNQRAADDHERQVQNKTLALQRAYLFR